MSEDDDLVVGAKGIETLDDVLDTLVVEIVDGVVEKNRLTGGRIIQTRIVQV